MRVGEGVFRSCNSPRRVLCTTSLLAYNGIRVNKSIHKRMAAPLPVRGTGMARSSCPT